MAAEEHKRRVALSSVAGALLITGLKLAVGLTTGSLGILAEAAHSGLDLVAAVVTYLAVRVSARPADTTHPYGHGKVENLSALFETALLALTCGWIIYEAVQRLFFRHVAVEATAWAFATMLVSIAVDVSRSRALARAARLYDSQALEADALHFSTDIWSSLVVLLGLALVRASQASPSLAWLERADALAALIVAFIVLVVSGKLGMRATAALLDAAPRGVAATLAEAVRCLPGVQAVRQVRVRRAGPDSFVDLTVVVSPAVDLLQAHAIASRTEELVQGMLPRADVVVHVEPADRPANGHDALLQALQEAAAALSLSLHGLRLVRTGDAYHVEVHAEVPRSLTVAQAHEIVSRFEGLARERLPGVADIITHIEPASPPASEGAAPPELHELAAEAQQLAESMWGPNSCHQVLVHNIGGRPSISLHCSLPPQLGIDQAHELAEEFERALRRRYPGLERVLVHTEPAGT